MSKTGWRYLLTLILCLSLSSMIPARGEVVELTRLRCRSSDNGSRITLDLSGKAEYEIIPEKGRISIALKGCKSGMGSVPNHFEDKLVRSIEVKSNGEDLTVTIDLKERANLSAFMTRSPYKLILDLYPLPKPQKPKPANPKPKLTPVPSKAVLGQKRSSPRIPPSKSPPQAARGESNSQKPISPQPERKPDPRPSPPATSPSGEDKSDAGSSSTDLASILNGAEEGRRDDIEMPKVGIVVSPFFVAQLFFNLILLAALYLLWRKVNGLASEAGSKGESAGAKEFSAVLDEVVDLERAEIAEADGDDPKVRKVKGMLKEGLSVDEIAKRTGVPKGEVELISSLSKSL